MAKKLASGLWSKDEVKLLKKLFANRRTQEVADQLGRSLRSVMGKARKMGIKKSKKAYRRARMVQAMAHHRWGGAGRCPLAGDAGGDRRRLCAAASSRPCA